MNVKWRNAFKTNPRAFLLGIALFGAGLASFSKSQAAIEAAFPAEAGVGWGILLIASLMVISYGIGVSVGGWYLGRLIARVLVAVALLALLFYLFFYTSMWMRGDSFMGKGRLRQGQTWDSGFTVKRGARSDCSDDTKPTAIFGTVLPRATACNDE